MKFERELHRPGKQLISRPKSHISDYVIRHNVVCYHAVLPETFHRSPVIFDLWVIRPFRFGMAQNLRCMKDRSPAFASNAALGIKLSKVLSAFHFGAAR